MNLNRLKHLIGVTTLCIVLGVSLSACGLFGSDDSDLDGDLSWSLQGPPETTMQVTVNTWDGERLEGGSDGYSIPSSGELTGDIEDGSYEGVMVSAAPFSSASLVVQLRSNGDVIGETDTPNEDGFYEVEVGEFPDFDDIFAQQLTERGTP